MPNHLVRDAIEQSRTREPLARAMTLLTGARVLAYMDLTAAKRVLAEGLSILEHFPGHFVAREIPLLAVPVDPDIAVSLYRRMDHSPPFPFGGANLMGQLTMHGFTGHALDLFEDLRYPVDGGLALLAASQQTAFQFRVLRAAKARWRLPRCSPFPGDFHRVFARTFRLIDPGEAAMWLDELLAHAAKFPSERISARFGNGVEFDTLADMYVFELLHVVRALKPEPFAAALLRRYQAVAVAAAVYPNGTESVMAMPPPPRPDAGKSSIALSSSISIEHLLDEAHHIFIDDGSNNAAPRAFWPATHAYRLALYWAGKRYGKECERYLQSIPDVDIAILAAIELAGGILALPMRQGSQRHSPRHDLAHSSPTR